MKRSVMALAALVMVIIFPLFRLNHHPLQVHVRDS